MSSPADMHGWFDGLGVVLVIGILILSFSTALGLLVIRVFGTRPEVGGMSSADAPARDLPVRKVA